jgi:ABC-type microcin C transport system permease subunit YejB
MRETINKTSLIRRPVLRTVMPTRMGIVAALTVFVLSAASSGASPQVLAQSQAESNNNAATTPSSQDGAMTPNEILALFEREARAAYAMNKQACDGLAAEEQKICLARARLQFDEDMRYAQKRAAQGY